MRHQTPDIQGREGQSNVPIGIPLTAIIALIFLFGSSLFSPNEKGSDLIATYPEHVNIN